MTTPARATNEADSRGQIVVRVQPGARRVGLIGWFDEIPKIGVAERAVDGAANAAAISALADLLGVKRRTVRLVAGRTARTKRFEIAGLSNLEIERRLTDVAGETN